MERNGTSGTTRLPNTDGSILKDFKFHMQQKVAKQETKIEIGKIHDHVYSVEKAQQK